MSYQNVSQTNPSEEYIEIIFASPYLGANLMKLPIVVSPTRRKKGEKTPKYDITFHLHVVKNLFFVNLTIYHTTLAILLLIILACLQSNITHHKRLHFKLYRIGNLKLFKSVRILSVKVNKRPWTI